jgi:1-acyl-sn-glycerol-3-phosphate acyltransferase
VKASLRKTLYVLYQPYKYVVFAPSVVAATAFFGSLAMPLRAFFNARVATKFCAVGFARVLSFLTPIRVKVFGRENIDRKQSYVVVSNHQSHYDPLVICGWSGLDIRWVMKKELRKIPLFGWACEKGGEFIVIDRKNIDAAIASMRAAADRIKNGTSVLFFAEGTRSISGKLGEFKKGAFKMAQDLKLPILPISVVNTEKILRAKSLKLFPGTADLVIHKPVDILKYGQDQLDQMIEEVKGIIQRGLDEYAVDRPREPGFAGATPGKK